MNTAIVTGAYGFAGANLTELLLDEGYRVFAVARPGSSHNSRFEGAVGLTGIELDLSDYVMLADKILEAGFEPGDFYFFHLAWGGDRNDMKAQLENINGAMQALYAAARLSAVSGDLGEGGMARFVATGSQAEYGICRDVITEDMPLVPITAYGKCKATAFEILKKRAEELGIDFIWARLFSLIGKYEPKGRMIPDMIEKLRAGSEFDLSSGRQFWDYLDARDAAGAMLELAKSGRSGEAYNIAYGAERTLRSYAEEAAKVIEADASLLHFGDDPEPFISLRANVNKLMNDTKWNPETSFEDSIKKY